MSPEPSEVTALAAILDAHRYYEQGDGTHWCRACRLSCPTKSDYERHIAECLLAAGWVPPEEAVRADLEPMSARLLVEYRERAERAEARVRELESSWVPPERVETIDIASVLNEHHRVYVRKDGHDWLWCSACGWRHTAPEYPEETTDAEDWKTEMAAFNAHVLEVLGVGGSGKLQIVTKP